MIALNLNDINYTLERYNQQSFVLNIVWMIIPNAMLYAAPIEVTLNPFTSKSYYSVLSVSNNSSWQSFFFHISKNSRSNYIIYPAI